MFVIGCICDGCGKDLEPAALDVDFIRNLRDGKITTGRFIEDGLMGITDYINIAEDLGWLTDAATEVFCKQCLIKQRNKND
jgi:hypothetical protein